MKSIKDILLSKTKFSEILMGNYVLVRAMIEKGVHVITSYPGSPTPEIADAISQIPKEERPFYFEFSINEKVAAEVACGASLNGHLSVVFFKSVGLNVAADSFVQLSFMNLIGGMVIVLGDDPGANSSQNEQDNRHIARMSYTPVFEPASPQEVYTMFKHCAKLAQEKHMPVILRLTTHVCHAKENVDCESLNELSSDYSPRFDVANGPYIPITKSVFPLKRRAIQNLLDIKSSKNEINTLYINHENRKKGIITAGLPFLSVMDVIDNNVEKPDLLKLGLIYPLPEQEIMEFIRNHEEILIVEELDQIIESDIKKICYENNIVKKIIGKTNIDDFIGEYTPEKVEMFINSKWKGYANSRKNHQIDSVDQIQPRPPQMCPGCGHRSAFFAIKKALSDEMITVADIGCHTLGYLPPYNMGEILLSMGHSNGTAAGLTLYNATRKVVSFIGDSTFFHAGLPGIINALFNKHAHVLIVMENGTTAMTGHQDHPGAGKNFNEITDKIPIRRVLEGLGVKHIYEVDTYQQATLTSMVKEALEQKEFAVVIAKHPCMLKLTREMRKRPDYKPIKVKVDAICNKLHVCVEQFGCPSFQREEDGTVWVQNDLCIGDGSCKQTCPTGALVQKRSN